ncbi:c-type cytochrome [Pseudoalteromonas fenneropenaei]|uniref:C-type cytochrome n=1 Tax=Pseudoalteromonas fenneropenaei TaxID=1737459 RepID=A0ABV7CQ54_9GAMM
MKKTLLGFALAAVFSSSVSANSLFEKPEDAIEYRQAAFQLIRYQIGDMGDMLKGKVPFDAERFKQRAHNAAQLAAMPWEAFIDGSDKGDTEALPAVWSDRATFDQKAQAFAAYAVELAAAADTGDQDKIKAAFGNWAKGCKDCHKSFKE